MNLLSHLSNSLHGYGNGSMSKSKEMELERRVAVLTAYADLQGKVTEASNYFYDIFEIDDTNNSCGVIESVSQTISDAISAGITKVNVSNTDGYSVGKEYTLFDETNREDVVIESKGVDQVITGYTEGSEVVNGYAKSYTLDNTQISTTQYNMAGPGGRKIVSDGKGLFYAIVTLSNTNFYLFKSVNYGLTWTQIATNGATGISDVALTLTDDNHVIVLYGSSTMFVARKYDSLGNLVATNTLDTISSPDGCSITKDQFGYLHIAYSAIHSPNSNSKNIIYTKSTDHGVTWSQPAFVTTDNTTGKHWVDPCIIVNSEGNPVILTSKDHASNYNLGCYYYTGSAWASNYLSSTDIYTDYDASAVVDSKGVIHVVWHGTRVGYTGTNNIAYTKSTDNGVTWASVTYLTSETDYGQLSPSIAVDVNDDLYVVWYGALPTSTSVYQLSRIKCVAGVWGSPEKITSAASHQSYPSVCADIRNFTDPVCMWSDSVDTAVVVRGTYSIDSSLRDFTKNIINTVVSKVGDIVYANSRKITRLSNGWLVVAISESSYTNLYCSKDNASSWQLLSYVHPSNTSSATGGYSIDSIGTVVYVFMVQSNGGGIRCCRVDATSTNFGTEISTSTSIDTGQTAASDPCVTVAKDGAIHVAWITKNSTYPNCYNIRYSKSINDGVTWDTPTQITNINISGRYRQAPRILVGSDNNPIILYENFNNPNYTIGCYKYNGSTWNYVTVFAEVSYGQARPSAIIDGATIHLIWDGTDATDTTKRNIKYIKSLDNGSTWGSIQKLTSGNSYDNQRAAISMDNKGNLHVVFDGSSINSPSLWQIRYIKYDKLTDTWSNVMDLTRKSANQQYVSVCDNYKEFTDPLIMWQDTEKSAIRFSGKFSAPDMYDVLNPTNVVGAAYDTSGNGGRKLVRLSNGWLGAVAVNATTVIWYISKDNGYTWSQLQSEGSYSAGCSPALVANGTTIISLTRSGNYAFIKTIDALTGAILAYTWADGPINAFLSGSDSASLAIDAAGKLHAVYTAKSAPYANSYNIKYSSSSDNGATWTAATWITTINNSSENYMQPCVVICDGKPVVITRYSSATVSSIHSHRFNGTTWDAAVAVHTYVTGTSTAQASPCAVVGLDGTINVVWHGYDSTDTSRYNIRYSKSIDGGVTWSAMEKLTVGNTYDQYYVSIVCDYSSDIHVYWCGSHINSSTYSQIRTVKRTAGVWGNISNLTSTTTNHSVHPQLCDNHKSFAEPLCIWKDAQAGVIKFRGMWHDGANRETSVTNKVGTGTTVQVINALSVTGSNNERRLVRLSNGWLISAVYATSVINCYVSKDNGLTFSLLCAISSGTNITGISMVSYGTNVYVLYNGTAAIARFDALTVSGTVSGMAIDSSQSSTYGATLAIASNGDLHAAWITKNASYPNSCNIRYSKSVDAGKTWAAVTQVTTYNNSSYQCYDPCMVVAANGNPVILYEYADSAGENIVATRWTGSAWAAYVVVHGDATYVQYHPSATVTPDGVIHLVWSGRDSTDTAYYNIRYSKSTDNGATWSVAIKLTSGNVYSQDYPSITGEKNGDVHVHWYGKHSGSVTYTQIRRIACVAGVWGSVMNVTSGTNHQTYVQTLSNIDYLGVAPAMWMDVQNTQVAYRGIYYKSRPDVVVAADYSTAGNGGRKLVRLSNGWYVVCVLDASTSYDTWRFYVSKDMGSTFSPLCYIQNAAVNYVNMCMVAYGTRITVITGWVGDGVHSYTFDAATIPNIALSLAAYGKNVDTNQTDTSGGCSLAVGSDGVLYAAWSSKNATYSNSFNIRYSKSTDGGATWAAPTQISTYNTAGQNGNQNPCILLNNLNNPVILFQFQQNQYGIGGEYWNGSTWTSFSAIVNVATYQHANPSAVMSSDGVLHVVWWGVDAVDAQYNIRYSKSIDNGVTWSAMVKITSGNTYSQHMPSITADDKNNLHVIFRGRGSGTYNNIRRISCINGTWAGIVDIMDQADMVADANDPQVCISPTDSIVPTVIYNHEGKVKVAKDTFKDTFVESANGGGSQPIYEDHPYVKFVSPTTNSYSKAILTRTTAGVDRVTTHKLGFNTHTIDTPFETYQEDIRMTINTPLDFNKFVAYVEVPDPTLFDDIKFYLSASGTGSNESYTEIIPEVVGDIELNVTRYEFYEFIDAVSEATLKIVITRTSLDDEGKINSILGAVA